VTAAIRRCILVPFDANAGQIWNLKAAGFELERFLQMGPAAYFSP
jgi:hypothetical protein